MKKSIISSDLNKQITSQKEVALELKRKEKLYEQFQKYLPDWQENLDLYYEWNKKLEENNSSIEEKLNNLRNLSEEIDDLNNLLFNLIQNETHKRELDPKYIQEKKIKIKNILTLLDILHDVITQILNNVRLHYLNPLTREITEIWRKLFSDQERFVSFDENLSPILKNQYGEIGYESLSGGEKTLLTIIAKTLIMHHFSNLDFMLLDEPLEHLDAVNRAQIIGYLKRFHDAGLIKQLIITTFEETLTRNFYKDEKVNLISLSAIKKYPFILDSSF